MGGVKFSGIHVLSPYGRKTKKCEKYVRVHQIKFSFYIFPCALGKKIDPILK